MSQPIKLYFSPDPKIRAWQKATIPNLREEIRHYGGTPTEPETVFQDDAALYINDLILQRDNARDAQAKT